VFESFLQEHPEEEEMGDKEKEKKLGHRRLMDEEP
jgi:hypothetical protein